MKLKSLSAMVSIAVLTGCASITGDSMQTLSVNTEDLDGNTVDQVACVLSNEKGSWKMIAPDMVSVHKASGDLRVTCEKENHPTGQLRAISRANAGMYGNIIFGGGVGAIIDHSKGTAYNYPDNLPVVMGKSVVIDRKNSEVKEETSNSED